MSFIIQYKVCLCHAVQIIRVAYIAIQNILDRLLLVFPRSRTEKKALAWTEDTRVSLLYQLLEPDPLQSGLHPVVFTGPLGPRCLRCVTVVYSPRPPTPIASCVRLCQGRHKVHSSPLNSSFAVLSLRSVPPTLGRRQNARLKGYYDWLPLCLCLCVSRVEGADIPAHARFARDGLPRKRLEEDLC